MSSHRWRRSIRIESSRRGEHSQDNGNGKGIAQTRIKQRERGGDERKDEKAGGERGQKRIECNREGGGLKKQRRWRTTWRRSIDEWGKGKDTKQMRRNGTREFKEEICEEGRLDEKGRPRGM